MGNSEVGHLNIGAGRVVKQELVRIGDAVEDGSIARRPALRRAGRGAEADRRHLPSDGPGLAGRRALAPGPRRRRSPASCTTPASRPSCTPSPTAATRRRNRPPRTSTRLQRRAAGRRARSPPSSAATSPWTATSAGTGSRKAYAAIAEAEGAAVRRRRRGDRGRLCRRRNPTSSFRPPVIGDYAGMKDGDGVLCFNFRADRVREILAALLDPAFDGFPRKRVHQVRRRGRHDALLRRARAVPGRAVRARARCTTSWARSSPTPARPSFAWRRPRNTRTSPTS